MEAEPLLYGWVASDPAGDVRRKSQDHNKHEASIDSCRDVDDRGVQLGTAESTIRKENHPKVPTSCAQHGHRGTVSPIGLPWSPRKGAS